jgi:hypothetical protein
VKDNAENFAVFIKDIGLQLHADKTNIFESVELNIGRSRSMEADYTNLEIVKEFKYLETSLTNQNYVNLEIKSSLEYMVIFGVDCCRPLCLWFVCV